MTTRSGRLGGHLVTLVLAMLVGLSGGLVGPLRGDALASPLPTSEIAAVRQAACEFRSGFKALRDEIPGVVGECVENERVDPASGDTVQRTTTGQLTWRKSDNVTAFTDGHRTWLVGPNGLQERLNDQRFSWEPSAPGTTLVGAGQGGSRGRDAARQSAVGAMGAPTAYMYDTLADPPALSDGVWPCLKENPSCNREPWWAEWNDLQDSRRVQYSFLGPGFVTEFRFAEAVGLLWQWPEGRDLLRAAADHGVRVGVSGSIPRAAFAGYSPRIRVIDFNPRFTETSTWMVASVLAHELKHAMDDWNGERQGEGFDDCVAREQQAYRVEARFTRWLYEQQGEFPTWSQVRQNLSPEDQSLFLNLVRIARAENPETLALEDYRRVCSPRR